MASTINVKIAPLPRGDYSSSATYAKLDVVSYNGSSYMAIKAVPTGTVPTNTTYWQLLAEKPTIGEGSITTDMLADGAVTADKLDSSVSEVYAEVSGTYEDMVVGSAEQLLSTQYDTDSVPYAFRKSPYGDREYDEIHGGTIAWNQLFPYKTNTGSATGWSWAFNNDGSVTITVTATSSENASKNVTNLADGTMAVNHKYLWVGSKNGIRVDIKSLAVYTDTVFNCTNAGYANVGLAFQNLPQGTYTLYPMLIDLTQMFGTSVADAIYAMEQSSTGSGVAFFRGLFPKPYYAYNAGQLISVSGLSAHKTVGFNAFDASTIEQGYIDLNTGNEAGSLTNYRSDYVPVLPSNTYCYTNESASTGIRIAFYDANKTFVGNFQNANSNPQTFTTPSNAYFLRFYWADISKACINLHWDGERDGEYEPYESHSYALDDSLTLRGVPKLVDNKVQFDGDVYASDGTVQRRYGIVDLGTLTFSASTNFFYRANSQDLGIIADVQAPIIAVDTNIDYVYYYSSSHQLRVYVKDVTKPLTGSLVYLLATPTTESASPYVNPQICNEYGTEEYISAEQSGVTMIVGHNTKYPQNLRKKIEGLPWNFSSLIAPTEVTNKATRNYTVGSFLIMNNTLYKVTSAIANGGTITVGSNVTATTIMQEILAL